MESRPPSWCSRLAPKNTKNRVSLKPVFYGHKNTRWWKLKPDIKWDVVESPIPFLSCTLPRWPWPRGGPAWRPWWGPPWVTWTSTWGGRWSRTGDLISKNHHLLPLSGCLTLEALKRYFLVKNAIVSVLRPVTKPVLGVPITWFKFSIKQKQKHKKNACHALMTL